MTILNPHSTRTSTAHGLPHPRSRTIKPPRVVLGCSCWLLQSCAGRAACALKIHVTPSLERRPLASSRRRRLCLLAAHESIVRAHPRRTVQHVDGARQLAVRPPRPWRCPSAPQSSKLHVRSANLHAWVASLRRHGGAQAARSPTRLHAWNWEGSCACACACDALCKKRKATVATCFDIWQISACVVWRD